jgi:hypothetical protein
MGKASGGADLKNFKDVSVNEAQWRSYILSYTDFLSASETDFISL